jgi:S1/P1 Nuclease
MHRGASGRDVVSWADEGRHGTTCIPVGATGYDPKHGNAIGRSTKVLADMEAPEEDRVESLKFLVHFVKDLHQPQHCAVATRAEWSTRVLRRRKASACIRDTLTLLRSKGSL